MRTTLICTVGTSLFNNLEHLKSKRERIHKFSQLISYYKSENWPLLAKALNRLHPQDRECGAEINTVEESMRKKWIRLKKIFLLVSDTDLGDATGLVLKHYFDNRNDLDVSIEVLKISDLQNEDPKIFKTRGLRNLVRTIGEVLRRNSNYAEDVAIDATGGYKAQIAIAVIMGQVLDIPVYYKHELFPEIIDFPPLPIAMDFDLLGRYAHIFTDLERNEVIAASDISEIDSKLKVLLEGVEIEGKTLYELSAIGQIYIEVFRSRYPVAPKLEAASENRRSKPTFGNDHHYPEGFKDFVIEVWSSCQWVETAWSISYAGQKGMNKIGFYVRQKGEKKHLVGEFVDRNHFGARFHIQLTDSSSESLTWAAEFLNRTYR